MLSESEVLPRWRAWASWSAYTWANQLVGLCECVYGVDMELTGLSSASDPISRSPYVATTCLLLSLSGPSSMSIHGSGP